MKDSKYYKKKKAKEKKYNKNNVWLSKALISIIIVLGSLIVTNFNDNIRNDYKKFVLEKNINFSSINKIYEKYIGGFRDLDNDDLVSNIVPDSLKIVPDDTGSYLINLGMDYPLTFMESGIIVYIGEKDDLGNTIIVQGNDGIDLWYSNVINTEYSLYDYVKKGDILGTLNSDQLLLTIMKDGNKLTYEEYFD